MDPTGTPASEDEMRGEYDLSDGVRRKYYEQYQEGTNVVFLEPDVAAVFRDSDSVNEALRIIINVARNQVRSTAGRSD